MKLIRRINETMYMSLVTKKCSEVCTPLRSVLQTWVCKVEAHVVLFAT